ncbi:class I SAM-dependent methyltransferase [Methylobacterium nigriterrae]|uniref:class I SAM-dependent methyltransferase n=1 Tax=Methylobacterium nigriterrae TaxID=3127512 RepID=UPI0030136D32
MEAAPVHQARHEGEAPACPITGRPAARHVQWVSARLLTDLWRYSGGVDVGHLLLPARRFGLWESPTGLIFFDPMVAGDEPFYRAFYGRIGAHDKLAGARTRRLEFAAAAGHVPEGARVLDVGCGHGGFRAYVPGRAYVGLDPNFAGEDPSGTILAETIAAHADRVGPVYDVVCAFQVLEHVAAPLAFARAMATCVKPGGALLIGTPLWPSPNTTIPNFIMNAPPHHLTWWTPAALETLARILGFEPERVHAIGMDRHDAMIHWMSTLTPIRCRDRYFRAAKSWYAALAVAYAGALVLNRVLPLPRETRPNTLLLAARKAAG